MIKGILSHTKHFDKKVDEQRGEGLLRVVLGIDVGVNGAIAVIGTDHALVNIYDVPTETIAKKNKRSKKRVDVAKLSNLFVNLATEFDVVAVGIEEVAARPNQGVVSMFGFGETFGIIKGLATATFNAPIHLILPRAWKHEFNLINREKDASRIYCQALYPFADDFRRKKDCDRADAVLIAKYLLQSL